MRNVYLALKRSVGFVLLLFCQAAIAQPVINAFSPTSAPPGTMVTITGSGFSVVKDSNIVYFGPVRTVVQNAGGNSLVVTVPTGATYAPITVTYNRLTAYSRLPFNVSFQNSNPTLDTNSFGNRKDVYGFNNPRSITLADLNMDGRADLFITNQGTNTGVVLRNTSVPGTVTFAPLKNSAVGPQPFGSAAGDFDGDGRLDIAVANINGGLAGSVSVLRNNSIGDTIRFDTTKTFAAGNATSRVAIEDIDRDGKPDLMAVSNNSAIISVFRNTTMFFGNITFAAKVDISTGFGPNDVAVGDIDGDGKPDLAAGFSGSNSGLSVWRNLSTPGTISFAPRVTFPTVINPGLVKIADLNKDGKPDVVVTNFGNANISIFKNQSTTGNISFAARMDFATGVRPRSIAIGDCNGDTRPDIAVTSDTPRVVSIFPNNSFGDTINLLPRVEYKTGSNPEGLAIGDVDGDGEVDLAFCNYNGGYAVSVLRNKQNGELPVIYSFTPTSGGKGTEVTIFGKYLSTTSAVKFGGLPADSVLVLSDSMIKAKVDTGATGNVSVYTLYGVASKPGFTFIADTTNVPDTTAPVIFNFWPTSGQKGTAVYILGKNIHNATAVRFGGVPADSIMFLNDSTIRAIVDTGATGSVSVQTPYGVASKPGFTFIADTTNIPDTTAPVIISFSPTSGQKGTAVYILGKNIHNATAVRFGGVPADSIMFLNDSTIRAIVDTGATGSVSVTTPFGTASKPGFTYISDTTGNDTLFVNARTITATGTTRASFVLYPNPASKFVIWQQPVNRHSTRLQLVDMTGRVVKQIVVGSNTPQTTIPLDGLQPGVYKLMWTDGLNKLSRTLLIK